jgi:hypothetical protein
MSTARLGHHTWLLFAIILTGLLAERVLAQPAPAQKAEELSTQEVEAERKRQDRRQFQLQELITARSGTWIFKPGDTPRIVWRDVEEVERLGGDTRLRVRWFNVKLEEAPAPAEPGRWIAWIEGAAPNGTP